MEKTTDSQISPVNEPPKSSKYFVFLEDFFKSVDTTTPLAQVLKYAGDKWESLSTLDKLSYFSKAWDRNFLRAQNLDSYKELKKLSNLPYEDEKSDSKTRAFFVYLEEFLNHYKNGHAENEISVAEKAVLVKDAGNRWERLSYSEKEPYFAEARKLYVEKNMEAYYKTLEEGPNEDDNPASETEAKLVFWYEFIDTYQKKYKNKEPVAVKSTFDSMSKIWSSLTISEKRHYLEEAHMLKLVHQEKMIAEYKQVLEKYVYVPDDDESDSSSGSETFTATTGLLSFLESLLDTFLRTNPTEVSVAVVNEWIEAWELMTEADKAPYVTMAGECCEQIMNHLKESLEEADST